MTKLDTKYFDPKTGVVSFRLRKPDGGWHRITIMPGDDVDYVMACNNANLEQMGHTRIDLDDESHMKSVIKEEQTEDVVRIFKAAQAAQSAKE